MGLTNVLQTAEQKIKKGAEVVGIPEDKLDKIITIGGWVFLGYLALKIINRTLNSRNERGA